MMSNSIQQQKRPIKKRLNNARCDSMHKGYQCMRIKGHEGQHQY